jgi:hypothetical protein
MLESYRAPRAGLPGTGNHHSITILKRREHRLHTHLRIMEPSPPDSERTVIGVTSVPQNGHLGRSTYTSGAELQVGSSAGFTGGSPSRFG